MQQQHALLAVPNSGFLGSLVYHYISSSRCRSRVPEISMADGTDAPFRDQDHERLGVTLVQAGKSRTRACRRPAPGSPLPQASFASIMLQSRRHVAAVACCALALPALATVMLPTALHRTYRGTGLVSYRDVFLRSAASTARQAEQIAPAGADDHQDRSSGPGRRRIAGPRCGRRAGSEARPLRFCPPLAPRPQPLRCAFAGVAGWVQPCRCGEPGRRPAPSSGSSSAIQTVWGERALACRHAPVTPSPSGPAISSLRLRRSFPVATLFDPGVPRHRWMPCHAAGECACCCTCPVLHRCARFQRQKKKTRNGRRPSPGQTGLLRAGQAH